MLRKQFWVKESDAKLVARLARKCRMTESEVVRIMFSIYSFDLWVETLKVKTDR